MVVRTENYADMENYLSEVFNLSKVDFKNEMKQICDSSDMSKGILVDFTKLYHLIEEWIIKRKVKKIEKIYFYHLTRYSGEYKKCLPLGKLLETSNEFKYFLEDNNCSLKNNDKYDLYYKGENLTDKSEYNTRIYRRLGHLSKDFCINGFFIWVDKEYGFKRYLNDLRYLPELINDISLEIDKEDDSTNLESKYREVFKNYGAAVLCVPIEDVNFFIVTII